MLQKASINGKEHSKEFDRRLNGDSNKIKIAEKEPQMLDHITTADQAHLHLHLLSLHANRTQNYKASKQANPSSGR